MPSIYVDIDISEVLDDLGSLSKRELRELRDEVNRLLGLSSGNKFCPDDANVDTDRCYLALLHLRKGNTEDAKWELERAFSPPPSQPLPFVKESKNGQIPT